MSRPRLVLHIGTHKTGTTSIQSWFARNAQRLAKTGICYPEIYANINNAGQHFIAQIAAGENAPPQPELTPRIAKLLRILKEAKADKILVSSELLSVVPPERIVSLFCDYDTQVFCILRRQDDYIESMFRELKKSSFFSGTVHDFLTKVLSSEPLTIFTNNRDLILRGTLPVDYTAMLDRWAACLGRDKVHAVAYDDPESGRDALGKVQRFLGLAEEKDDRASLNASMGARIIQARSLLDTHLDWESRMAIRPAFWKANAKLGLKDDFVFLGSTERRYIFDVLQQSNQRLRETYLNGTLVPWLCEAPQVSDRTVASDISALELAEIAAFVIRECAHELLRARMDTTGSAPQTGRRQSSKIDSIA